MPVPVCAVCEKVVTPSTGPVLARVDPMHASGEEACEREEACDTCLSGEPVLEEVGQVLELEVEACDCPLSSYECDWSLPT